MLKEIKTSTGVLFILAFAAVVFGGLYTYANVFMPGPDYSLNNYVQSPSVTKTDATKDWKTYSNTDYGYSVKYPTQWTAGPESSPTSLGIYLSNSGKTQMQIVTVAKAKYTNESLDSFASDFVTPKDKSTITDRATFKIGSNNGIKELVTISDPASNGLWYFTENSSYYTVFLTSEEATSSTTSNILSTFKFTSSDSTADWQTYAGKYEGISLKYPSTWKLALTNKTANDYGGTNWKGPFDGFTLTSPNNFVIKYTTHIDGLGGGCDVGINCTRIHFYGLTPIADSNFTDLQIIESEVREQDDVTVRSRNMALWSPNPVGEKAPIKGSSLEGWFYTLYKDKGVDKTLSELSGSFSNPESHLKETTAEYFNLPDVVEAKNILGTVKFK